MYIQITTRCNMECAHCCSACTAKGKDMSTKTFKKALEYDDMVSIGGGEPTIHPKFWEFLGLAIGSSEYVWLATNGKETDIALALAKIAKKGVIGCDLSQDDYHDTIDYRVVKAFTKSKQNGVSGYYDRSDNDGRNIRDVSGKEINGGRCDFGRDDNCACSGMICEPDGTVKACGCADAPKFGNVNGSVVVPEDYQDECHKYKE